MTPAGTRFGLLSGLMVLLAAWVSAADAPAPPARDPSARLSSAAAASEYWNLTARFDGGYRLFARFGITNQGPGERTAGALWYLVHPDGRVSEFRNGRTKSRWTVSRDGLYIDVASSTLDLRAPVRRLELDTTSQGGRIMLRFPAADLAPAPAAAGRFHAATLQTSAPIEGTIWEHGMAAPVAVRGTTTLTHVWMDERLADVLRSHTEFVGAAQDLTVYLSNFVTPAGAQRRSLLVEHGGTIVYQSADLDMVLDPPERAARDPRYPLPGRLLARAGRVSLEVRAEGLLHRTNPLAAVPQPFRFLFSLEIDPRFVWTDASFRLTLPAADGAPREVEGRGILAIIFVNPRTRGRD
jgi:hypothetical protein